MNEFHQTSNYWVDIFESISLTEQHNFFLFFNQFTSDMEHKKAGSVALEYSTR